MSYKVLYNPALLINELILFGDTLLNMSVNVKLLSNKINLEQSYSIQSTNIWLIVRRKPDVTHSGGGSPTTNKNVLDSYGPTAI